MTEATSWWLPVFSFRTTARLSKQQIEQDIVRKARHMLKRAAAAT